MSSVVSRQNRAIKPYFFLSSVVKGRQSSVVKGRQDQDREPEPGAISRAGTRTKHGARTKAGNQQKKLKNIFQKVLQFENFYIPLSCCFSLNLFKPFTMKLSYYFRSPVLSWHDLSAENQKEFSDQFTAEQKEGLFIFDDLRNELFSLDSFLTVQREKRYQGVFGQTYFSAYFITLSRCGTEAIVSYRYC